MVKNRCLILFVGWWSIIFSLLFLLTKGFGDPIILCLLLAVPLGIVFIETIVSSIIYSVQKIENIYFKFFILGVYIISIFANYILLIYPLVAKGSVPAFNRGIDYPFTLLLAISLINLILGGNLLLYQFTYSKIIKIKTSHVIAFLLIFYAFTLFSFFSWPFWG